MIPITRLATIRVCLVGLGLSLGAVLGGCSGSSEQPVMTDQAKQEQQEQMELSTNANDAAAGQAAAASRGNQGLTMPP